MSVKIRSLVGSAAVAGLVIAGTVAASAADPITVERVGSFEIQGKGPDGNNLAPAGWFSEHDDDVAGITIGEDSVLFAASPKSVGLNKIVDVEFDADAGFEIDATGTARYSIVLTSDDVDYLRITALESPVTSETKWAATGFWKGGVRTPAVSTQLEQTLAEWAADENPWDAGNVLEGATLHQIGARHFSGEGAGSVHSLTYGSTKYVFGKTSFNQADVDAAVAAAVAPLQTQVDDLTADLDDANAANSDLQGKLDDANAANSDLQGQLDAANAKVAELEKALADAKADTDTRVAALESSLAAAVKAGDKASNRALKARAQLPYRITGKAQVGQTLRAKGKKFKNIDVAYQWRVGKQNAGKKATLKLKKRHAGKVVRLTVTKSYENAAGKTVSVKRTVRALKVDRVTR